MPEAVDLNDRRGYGEGVGGEAPADAWTSATPMSDLFRGGIP
jgi:hypothetical protein